MQSRDNRSTEKAHFGGGKTREQQMSRESFTTNVEQHGSTNVQSRNHEQCTENEERMFSCTRSPNVDKVFCDDDLRSGNSLTRSCNFIQDDKMVDQMRYEKGWEHRVLPQKHASNVSSRIEKTFPYQETPNYDQMFGNESLEDLEKSQTSYREENSQTSYRFDIRSGDTSQPLLTGYSRQVFSSEPMNMAQSEARDVFLSSNTAAAQSPDHNSDDEFYDCETHSERFRRALSHFETSGLQSDKDIESSQTSFRTKSISKKSCHFAEPEEKESKYLNKSIRTPSDYEDVFYSETKNEHNKKVGSTSQVRQRNDTGYGSGSSMFSNNESLSEQDNYEITGIRIYQPQVTVQKIVTNSKSDAERRESTSNQEYRNADWRNESTNTSEGKGELEFQRSNSSSLNYESNESKMKETAIESGTNRIDITNKINIELESKISVADKTSKSVNQDMSRIRVESNSSSQNERKSKEFQKTDSFESSKCVNQDLSRIRVESNSSLQNEMKSKEVQKTDSFESSTGVKYTIKGLGTITDNNKNERDDIQSKLTRTISFEDSPSLEQKKKKIKVKVKKIENLSNEPITESTKKTDTSSSLQPSHVPLPRSNISFAFVSKDTLDRVTSQAKKFPPIKSSDCSTMIDLQKADARIGKIVTMLKQNHTDISNDVIQRKLSTNQNKEMVEKKQKPVKTSFQIKLKNPEVYKSDQVGQSSTLNEDNTRPIQVSTHNKEATSRLTVPKEYSDIRKSQVQRNESIPKDKVSTVHNKEEIIKSKRIEPNIVESKDTIQKTSKSTSNVKKPNSTLNCVKTEKSNQEMNESQKEKDIFTLDFGPKPQNKIQGQKGQIKSENRKHRSSRTVEEKTIVTNIVTTEDIHEMGLEANLVENLYKRKSKSIPVGLDRSSKSVPSAITLNGNIKVQFEADDSGNFGNEKLLKKGMDARTKQRSRTESYERILSAPYRKSSEGAELNKKGIMGQYLDKLMKKGEQKGTSGDNQNKLRPKSDGFACHYQQPRDNCRQEIQGGRKFSTQSASQDLKTGSLKTNEMDLKDDLKKSKNKYSSDSDIKRRSRTVSFERILPTYHQNRRKNSEQNEKPVSRREVKIFQLLNKNQNLAENEEANKRTTDIARQYILKHLKEGGKNTQKAPSEVTLHHRSSSISSSDEEKSDEDDCYCEEEMESYRFEKLSPAKYNLKGFGCCENTSNTPKNEANVKLSNDAYKMMKNNEDSSLGDCFIVCEESVEAMNEKLAKLQAVTNMKTDMDKNSTEIMSETERLAKLQVLTSMTTDMDKNSTEKLAKLHAVTNMKMGMDKNSNETISETEKLAKLQAVTNTKTEMIRNTLSRNIDNRRISSSSANSDIKTTLRRSNESIRADPNRNTNTEIRQQQKQHNNVISMGISQQNVTNQQTGIHHVIRTDQTNSEMNNFHKIGHANEEINNHYNYSNSPVQVTINNKEANSIYSTNSSENTFYHEKKGFYDSVDSINQDMTTKKNMDQRMNSKTVGKKNNQCLLDRGGEVNDLHENDNNKNIEGRNSSKRTVYKCNITKCHEVPLNEKNKGNSCDEKNVNKEILQQVKNVGRVEEVSTKQIKSNEAYNISRRLNENNTYASSCSNSEEANTLHSMEDSRKSHDTNNPLLVHMKKNVKHSVEYENILPNRNSREKMDVIFREFVDLDKPKTDGNNGKKTAVTENKKSAPVFENNKRPVSEGYNDKSKKMMRRRSVKIYSTAKDGGMQKEKAVSASKSESDVTSTQNKFINPESPSINLLNCHDPFETVCSLEKCTLCHHHGNKNENTNKEVGGKVKNHETTISYEYKLDRRNPIEKAQYRDVIDNYKKTHGDLKENESDKPLNVIIRRNVNHEITKTELLVEMNKTT